MQGGDVAIKLVFCSVPAVGLSAGPDRSIKPAPAQSVGEDSP